MPAEHFEYKDVMLQGADTQLHLITAGNPEGRPILFLHGITENAEAFLPVMKLLPENYYLIALDLRGRGQSFKPAEGYRHRDYIEDLLTVWNLISGHSEPPIVVAHSLSGRIAASFAEKYSRLIGGLLLIDPPISGPGRKPFPLPMSRFTGPKAAIELGDVTRFNSYYANTKMDVLIKASELKQCSVEAIEQSYRSLNEEPFHTNYRLIDCPAVLLAAELSPLITEEERAELNAMNINVITKRIPGVGHEIHKEAPDVIAAEVMQLIHQLQ